MSALEFLHTFPSQRKALLFSLGVVDGNPSTTIKFETHVVEPRLPYYVSLLVHVECLNNTIKCIVIDEGAVAFMMSLACWKGLGSPTLSKYGTCMLTAFDGIYFWSHGILPSLEVQLGGKTIEIKF